MINFGNTEVVGWEAAIRGMRNPKNSWDRSDSISAINSNSYCTGVDCSGCLHIEECDILGPNDHKLMMTLAKGGPVHAKYRRMIVVYVDITAPLYWWKEFDTYKVGTVANSCSTMHKIHAKEFTLEDFSHEHLIVEDDVNYIDMVGWLQKQIDILNEWRRTYLDVKDSSVSANSAKKYWWQMIQLLPSSYNQKRTIMLNYEVLAGIYPMRKDHKLDEWHDFCHWIEGLPYSEIIVGENK